VNENDEKTPEKENTEPSENTADESDDTERSDGSETEVKSEERDLPAETETEAKSEERDSPAETKTEPKAEKAERPPRTFYSVLISYGALQNLGYFKARTSGFSRGDICVIKTDRGLEIGEALSSAEEMESEDSLETIGNVIRKATGNDLNKMEEIESKAAEEEARFCSWKIRDLKLPMKLAMVEHLFGGDKIIFYFLADGRVDFRELVKELAREYRTRIEMRQIGVRDEAKLVADYEHCGREICCKSFMQTLDPVTMKMAKNQKATLDPTKISGACGRLMCCLRFEDQVYADLKDNLPRKGSILTHKDEKGEVLDINIITESIRFVELGGDIMILHRRELRGECISAGGNSKWWKNGKYDPSYTPTDEDRQRLSQYHQEFQVERNQPRRSKPQRPASVRTPAAVEKPDKAEPEQAHRPPTEEPKQTERPRRRRRRGGRGRRKGGQGQGNRNNKTNPEKK
jgi:cell fate regulator YaaT (PSP1 superfamily)